MRDSSCVRGFERAGDLQGQGDDLVERHPSTCQLLAQRLAGHELGGDEVDAGLLPDLINGDDVGMIGGRGGARLAFEALDQLRVRRELQGEEFERNAAVELRVVGQINLAHPAHSEQREDVIMTDAPPDGGAGRHCRARIGRRR